MSPSITAYLNLQVAPYQLVNLQELNIIKKINDHARLYFTGIVAEELKDSYIEMTNAQTPIEISQIDESGGSVPLFKGIVLNIDVKAVRDIYYLEVEAVSHTYELDVKLNSRSFQDIAMPYTELIQKVIADYPGADFIDMATNGQPIKSFTLQDQETDWEFLKRMASRFNVGLVPVATQDKPKFFFGAPEGDSAGQLEDYHYSVRKKISAFRKSSENYNQSLEDNDYIYYEVETEKILDIGSTVQVKDQSLYICEADTLMKDSILKHLYILTPQKGMSQDKLYNEKLVGVSVQGKVIDVAKDNIKAHLEIDKEQSVAKAYWFPYSSVYTAEGNSGWYCMPELDDYVRIYLPSKKEEEAIALSSVRKHTQSGDKLDDPDIKYFRTKAGKEMMFSPGAILISAKDGETYVQMTEKDGIQIITTKNIKITSTQADINLDAENIVITAKKQIDMTCKESNIKMVDSVTSIKGKEVKTN